MPLPQLANPRTARRFAGAVLLLGGVLAGLGTSLRGWIAGGNDQWTFLLDTAGLLVVIIGAGLDFRASGLFTQFDVRGERRRAFLQILFGLLAAGMSCLALGWLASDDWPAVAKGILALLLTLGIGVGFAGLLYIGWFSGGNYLERRIEQQSEEDW